MQFDRGNKNLFMQQRQRGKGGIGALQLHHRYFRNIGRVAQYNILSVDLRPGHPAAPARLLPIAHPVHAEIAANGERTVQLRRDFLVDGWLQTIPVEGCDYDDNYHNQQTKIPITQLVIFPARDIFVSLPVIYLVKIVERDENGIREAGEAIPAAG